MNYGEAVEVLAANAACQLQNGCAHCPIYANHNDKRTQQGYCKEFASVERIKEAVDLIHQIGILNQISIL